MVAQIFVDLDGVLADFDKSFEKLFGCPPNRDILDPPGMWEVVKGQGDFFLTMEPLADAHALWGFVEPLKPIILSGSPKEYPDAAVQKRQWVVNQFGPKARIITCQSKMKCAHMKQGDILIDDWVKYRHLWLEKGGVWISHYNAETTIKALLALGYGL